MTGYQLCQIQKSGKLLPITLLDQPIPWIKRRAKFSFIPILYTRSDADEAIKVLNKDNQVQYTYRTVTLPD